MRKVLFITLMVALYTAGIFAERDCGQEYISTIVAKNAASSDIIIKYSPDKNYVCMLYNDGFELSLYNIEQKKCIFALAPLKEMKSFWFDRHILVIKYGRTGNKVGYNIKTGKILWKNSLFGVLPRVINKNGYYLH